MTEPPVFRIHFADRSTIDVRAATPVEAKKSLNGDDRIITKIKRLKERADG